MFIELLMVRNAFSGLVTVYVPPSSQTSMPEIYRVRP